MARSSAAKKQASKHEREEANIQNAFDIIQRWYEDEVDRWADDFEKRIQDGEFSDRNDFIEKFDQETDGSQIVIYTMQARMALLVSKNDEAYMEEMGEAPDPNGPMFYEVLALYAFRRDIQERMDVDINDEETFKGEAEEDDED